MTTYEISGWSFARDGQRLVAREAWRSLLAGTWLSGAWAAVVLALAALFGAMRPGHWTSPALALIGLVGVAWFVWRLRAGRRGFVLDRDADSIRSRFNEELPLGRIVRFELRVESPDTGPAPFLGLLAALTGEDAGLILFAADDYDELDQADALGRQFAEFLGVPFVRRSEPAESVPADRFP
jgi:hypothetical protein